MEEYRARTFEVKVKTPMRHGFLGQPLAFEVEASFLYGSPLAGGKLDWSVRRRRYLPRFEGWEEYSFQDFAELVDQGHVVGAGRGAFVLRRAWPTGR